MKSNRFLLAHFTIIAGLTGALWVVLKTTGIFESPVPLAESVATSTATGTATTSTAAQ